MLGDPEGRRRTVPTAARAANEERTGRPARRGPKGIRLITVRQQAKPSYRRLWMGGAAVALVLFLAWWLLWPSSEEKDAALPLGAVQTPTGEIIHSPAPGIVPATVPETAAPQEAGPAFIKAVQLLPSQPTRRDTLRAEVTLAPEAPSDLAYRYEWKVNDRVVTGATGSSLNLADLKKKDRVSVTLIPAGDGGQSAPVASPEVIVHSIAPTLNLELRRPAGQGSGPADLVLVSVAPDSTELTFSLEPPLIKDMTIDKATGRITWPRPPELKGVFLFGAAVVDENQTRVTRTFEIALK